MERRLQLHNILVALIGNENVYFQPPSNVMMQYPCIVYSLDDMDSKFADNQPYVIRKRYSVLVIDRNPDSEIPNKVARLESCIFSRAYITNNLNHYAFNLYF